MLQNRRGTNILELFYAVPRIQTESLGVVEPPTVRMDKIDSCCEAELLKLSLAGEEPAFFVLYERLKHNIFRYAYDMTGSKAAAEEVV